MRTVFLGGMPVRKDWAGMEERGEVRASRQPERAIIRDMFGLPEEGAARRLCFIGRQ